MKVNTSKSKNAESFYIKQSYIDANGKSTSRTIRKLGTLDELLKEHLFGYGKMCKYLNETLPDYFLITKGRYIFFDGEEPIGFKGAHAGGTKEEKELYLFAFND